MKLKFIIRIAMNYAPECYPIVSTKYNDRFIDELVYVPGSIYRQRLQAQAMVKFRVDQILFWVPLEYIKIN